MIHFPRPSSLTAFLRSRLRPSDIGWDVVQEVMQQYGLSTVGKPVNLALSRRTANVVISTNAGRVVLKRYRDHLQTEGIQYIHSILARLIELAFPVPRLFHTPSGVDYISLNAGRFAVFEFTSGSDRSLEFLLPSDRLRLIETSGRILASFHRALRGFQPAGAHHLGFVSHTGGWQRDTAWFANKLHELRERSTAISNAADREIADFLISHSQETFDEFCRLDEKLQKVNLMRTIIHGDFGLHNLIFKRDDHAVLVDFETARIEWRLADLVSTLSRSRSGKTMYDLESIGRFMTGYQSVDPVSEEEWQSLPDVWRFFKLRSVFINWNSYFERGSDKLSSAIDAYHQAAWAKDNPLTLLKLRSL